VDVDVRVQIELGRVIGDELPETELKLRLRTGGRRDDVNVMDNIRNLS